MNSLGRVGFTGHLIVGYRGELPPWVGQLRTVDAISYSLKNGMQIVFRKLEVAMHFSNNKSEFLPQVLEAIRLTERSEKKQR